MTVKVRVTTTYTHSAVIDAPDDFDPNYDRLTAEMCKGLLSGLEVYDLDVSNVHAEWEFGA